MQSYDNDTPPYLWTQVYQKSNTDSRVYIIVRCFKYNNVLHIDF